MKGLLWPLPDEPAAKEWARLSQTEDVQAFLTLIDAQRQALLEELATAGDNDLRTYLQGQCAALAELQTLGAECAEALRRTDEREDEHGPGERVREWLRGRTKRFRI